ncbi:hypothetical protein Taro_042584 [Colocasia esculenta]|uniref:Uncharacterized protein n=1 Tax=Colocasia esculenta TaxID=4460 RepID=A0A843WZV0_COLES|nr:hypothetical protein [Colocasia esculenta]
MFLVPQRQESPYTSRRSLLAAKGGFPDLSPSPEAASHPFKRKDKGIKGNPWREVCCARQESPYTSRRSLLAAKGGFPDLSPSPEAASHPFKRKDKGIKGNPWREVCCARQGSRSN